jgi:dipeptidyl aminopeptidase/acylaminoacyl peptidase
MANWIQGHNDITNFKAIVCHDGILDTRATWFATEEIYFPEHDLGGTPWEVPAEYDKWNPLNHIRNWKTVG